MSILSYRLQIEMVPDDLRNAIDELYSKMLNQDWHGIQLTLMRNGKYTVDVQVVLEDSEGGEK
jgi:hypothetical protein